MENDIFTPIHLLLKNQEYEQAKALLLHEGTGRLNPPYTKKANHAWYLLGNIAFENGSYAQALNDFHKSYASSSYQDEQALLAISNCHFELGEFSLAEQTLKQGLQHPLDPKTKTNYLYNLGNALFDQQKYIEAAPYYKIVATQQGELAKWAKRNLALCTKKLKTKQQDNNKQQ